MRNPRPMMWADRDYISARVLLLRGFLVQGAALSDTAVEKYLKTVCLVASVPFPMSHNASRLAEIVRARGINLALNQAYLDLLTKAYRMRYPDDLEPGFNIVLSQPKLLTELDSSVHEVRKGFNFARTSGKPVETYLDALARTQDAALLQDNFAFANVPREEIFRAERACYELRVLPDGSFIDASYETTEIRDDRDLKQTGRRPGP